MPSKPLSASNIASLTCEAGKVQTDYFDEKLAGFGVRVSSGGTKSYFVQCRVAGRKNPNGRQLEIRHTLGKVTGKLDDRGRLRPDAKQFDAMYEGARKVIADAGKGITPADREAERESMRKKEESARRLEEQKDVTLDTLFKKYLEDSDKLKESTKTLYRQCINTHLSDWLDLPARSIDKDMVKDRHKAISERHAVVIGIPEDKIRGGVKRTQGGKGAADGTMRVLRAIFNYGIEEYEEAILVNPVAKALSNKRKTKSTWHKLGRRQSVVEPSQLKEWFAGLAAITHPGIKLIVQIAMFTGARKNEITSLKWSDLADLDGAIPTALFRETKAGEPLLIPLAAHVVNLIKDYKAVAFSGPDGYLFPARNSKTKTGHISDARKQIKKAADAGGVGHMMHDLRRCFVTYCNYADVSVPPLQQKRLIGHALPKDVTEGYGILTMEELHRAVEKVAAFILKHAGIDTTPEPDKADKPATDKGGKVIDMREQKGRRKAA